MHHPPLLSTQSHQGWAYAVCAIAAVTFMSCAGASSSAGASVDEDDRAAARPALTRAEALALMDKIERDPLSDGAATARPRVFAWLISHPSMQGLQMQGRYLKTLEESDHPYGGELLMQFAFGMSAFRLRAETGVISKVDEIEAGLRSVVTAYHVMVKAEPELRLQFLNDLDEIIRRGKVRDYIGRVDAIEAGE